jgi:hypothetical protein
MEYLPILLQTLTFISDLFFTGKGNINHTETDYKRKQTVAILLVAKNEFVRLTCTKQKLVPKCKTPRSLQLPCSTISTNIKNTDKIIQYVHSAGCLQSIMANSKFCVVGGRMEHFLKIWQAV